MQRINVAKVLGYVVLLFGLFSAVALFLGIDWLKIICPFELRMEFLTAVSFVPAGIILVFVAKISANEDRFRIMPIILPIFSLMILLLMATLFFAITMDLDYSITGEVIDEVMMKPGMGMGIAIGMNITEGSRIPLVATITGFILISLSGLFMTINIRIREKILLFIGTFVLTLGLFVVILYIVNYMHHFYGPLITPPYLMPIDLSLLFVIWGLGMTLCSRDANGQS